MGGLSVVIGRVPPLTIHLYAAPQLSQNGHSCVAQNFDYGNDWVADLTAIGADKFDHDLWSDFSNFSGNAWVGFCDVHCTGKWSKATCAVRHLKDMVI